MRDAARSGKKRWALGNWDLRWKVTAVLAVPLAVAVGLGVSRITAEFSNAQRLAEVSGNIEAIPAVTGLSAATAAVAGAQLVSLNGQTVVADKDLTELDAAIAKAEGATALLASAPNSRSSLESMITEAKAVRAVGKAPTVAADSLATIDRVRNFSVRIVETTVSQVNDQTVDTAKLRLVDSLNTRATLVGELATFSEVLQRKPDGLQNFLTSTNTERTLLNVLSHRFPDGDAAIADLYAGVDTRVALMTSPEAIAGRIPLGEAKTSLQTSVAVYERVVGKATKDIEAAMDTLSSNAKTDAWTYTAVVIATILAALLLAVFVARSMIVPLHRLRLAALRVAESDLPHEVAQLRNGASPEDVPLEPMPVRSTEEIGQLARAVDDIHGQALRLASDQAQMRSQVNDMFETLARRSKSLVDHQLSLIEAMEYDEKDPRLLENLFRLDHLAARMRRNGDNLLILAGTKQRRAKSAPVEIADVLRAAISEVEDYERVKLGATPRGSLKEPAASDLAHLFAELLDNALRASPPETDVKFTFAQAHDQGLLIEVADRGIGMPPTEMSDINRRLEQTAEPGPDTARHMGLFVVGRLAERHGLSVRLRPTFDTARDPGVTVTVHVPVGLIVAGQAIVAPQTSAPQAVQPNPQNPQPSTPQRQAATTSSSMQTRAVTRTPGGNMMVTVDPGVSGPIPISKPASGPTPAAAGGLPQRQPGSTMSTGTRQDQVQSSPTLRPAPGQQHSAPQRGKLAAANLPKRNIAPGGPPRPPGGPSVIGPAPSSGGLPPRDSGDLPQRQAGANGAPPVVGGLPQRTPGANGAPQRDGLGGPQRDAAGGPPRDGIGAPPRDSAPTGLHRDGVPPSGAPRDGAPSGLPQRQPGAQIPSGLSQREPGAAASGREPSVGGLPTREPGASGIPGGLPQREPGGLPQRESGGLPQREPGGLPKREPGGLPPRESGGLAPRESGGLPQREPGGLPPREAGGLPQRESGGLPAREPGGLPQRDPGGLPQRQPAAEQPRDGAPGVLPSREPLAGGLPQRRPGAANGVPSREPSAGGIPPRDGAPIGLPQREPRVEGLPQRQPSPRDADSGALPVADALSGPLPTREPGGVPPREPGVPPRDSGAASGPIGLPQREPGAAPGRGGLPQRDPGATGGLPQRAPGLPAREPGGVPQRRPAAEQPRTGAPNGLPTREPLAGGLPRRQSGPGGLPQREPGATNLPREVAPPGVALPQREALTDNALGDDAARDPGKHSLRSNTAKTASFFQTRLQPAEESGSTMDSPIFAEMMSAWLSDPNPDRSQVAAAFDAPGDEGWQAARRASEAQAETKTAAGLPQRSPGVRLVPGAVSGNTGKQLRRDPESIRSSLSRHQQGVRDGRAVKAPNLTGDKGDR
ncbi:HAMP domain-containing protein [Nocardia sp. NEAU-351]|uniref:histidine kinase n=2 Tax=Nocardia bovistercoris TaxID=2785916 RepID=A0A931IJ33_9NOCA|nr:HAMP domain-containing protein [Nocardia bovistercoris]